MDWSSIIQMAFGGGVVAGIVELGNWIRNRKADKAKAEAEAAQASATAEVSDVEAQKAKIDLGDLYQQKVLEMMELINIKQDKGNVNQDKMIQMLGDIDRRVDNLEVRMANVEGCLDGELTAFLAKQNKK